MSRRGEGVLLIGMGGLGCATALALAQSGITRLGLADPDQVALSNLHRQILYNTDDIGCSKVERAAVYLTKTYRPLQIEPYPLRLDDTASITALAAKFQVVVDGSDNFPTRFAANDAAVQSGFYLVHGAATGLRGQLTTIAPGGAPCLRCLFEGPPSGGEATCRSEGVLGPLVGEVGWLMAMEAIKHIRGIGVPLHGKLLTIDLERGIRRTITLTPNPRCLECGSKQSKS